MRNPSFQPACIRSYLQSGLLVLVLVLVLLVLLVLLLLVLLLTGRSAMRSAQV